MGFSQFFGCVQLKADESPGVEAVDALSARPFSRNRAEVDRDHRSLYGDDVHLAAAGERQSSDRGEKREATHRGIMGAPGGALARTRFARAD